MSHLFLGKELVLLLHRHVSTVAQSGQTTHFYFVHYLNVTLVPDTFGKGRVSRRGVFSLVQSATSPLEAKILHIAPLTKTTLYFTVSQCNSPSVTLY